MMMTCERAADEVLELGELSAGATRVYVRPERDQLFLLPVCMRDWLEEGHLAWFVLDVVGELDSGPVHRCPGGSPGRPPYQPEMMVALLLYAYCCGVRSSRRIEAACRTDAAYRVICGGLVPDHATIARFVADHEQALEGLFVEGVRLCAAAGLADLSLLALDGTKIAADAALDRNRGVEWIRGEVAKLMVLTAQDESATAGREALPGVDAAGEISSPGGRIARLRAALEVIEAENAAAATEAARQAQAAAAEAEQGRQVTGRKPQEPLAALARAEVDHAVALKRSEAMHAARAAKLAAAERGEKLNAPPRCPIETANRTLERAAAALAAARETVKNAAPTACRANITDPDSRIMKTPTGWVQGYNAQAIVNQHQIVLTCDVSQDHGDVQLYQPMTDTLTQTLSAAGIQNEIELILADAGYWSEENATAPGPGPADRHPQGPQTASRRPTAGPHHRSTGPRRHTRRGDGAPPAHTPGRRRLRATLQPDRADLRRPQAHRGIRSFRRRGLNAARSEWAFMHLAGNMLKLHQHRAATA